MMLRKKIFLLGVGIGALFISACSENTDNKSEILLQVNGFTISKDEAMARMKHEAELDSNFYLVRNSKKEFVNDLIQSQLLIQEAKKHNFDQREVFRQTIQRYWESTLIRDLLAERGEQFRKTTVVTEEEIEAFSQKNKGFLPQVSGEELQKAIVEKIIDIKVGERLAKWIEELKVGAKIVINDPEVAEEITGKK